jgi:cobalt-zinc-cadmium efflux system outer membrane protein
MTRFRWTPLGLVFLGVAACTTPRHAAWPDASPLGDTVTAYRPPASPTTADALSEPPPASGTLTLHDALARALQHNPRLRAFAWEIRAREAQVQQAGRPPNPELGADLEDFAGTGLLRGFDATEVTVGLSQLVELGGDRRSRRRVAASERDLAGWDYETVRLDVLTETTQAFTAVLAAQERLALADSLLARAEQFYQSVGARAAAGKVSALEERRAQVVRSTTRLALERARQTLSAERTRLAAAWGSNTPGFHRAAGDLAAVEAVPSYERLDGFIERNPDVARWRDEMTLRRSAAALEHARRIPDPVVTVGTRHLRELGETALAVGVSVPLPLFDRNRGGTREAAYRLRQGEAARQARQVESRRRLAEAYGALAMAYTEVTTLREDVLPAARENFTATEEGYLEGKFDLLMVLDAQHTLFEVANQYIDALAAYHAARAGVERLIATPLSDH